MLGEQQASKQAGTLTVVRERKLTPQEKHWGMFYSWEEMSASQLLYNHMDMRLLGITLLLLALTLPTADPSANSVAVDSPLAAPSRRGCTGDLACSCRHHHWTHLLVSVLWELLSWDPFQGAFFTISVSDAFSLWTPSDLFSIFH